jgi:transposase
MRFAGIDVASQTHVVAVVDEIGHVLVKPTPFTEDAPGYEKLFAILGTPDHVLVALEATGHYGRNLLATLHQRDFHCCVINPLRTRRFAQEELARAKTDSIDALGIARFAAQKRPPPTPSIDTSTDELRELVRFYDRVNQDLLDRIRQVHRLIDLCFPEFTRYVLGVRSRRATAILGEFPTAAAFTEAALTRLAEICYDGTHRVGPVLARNLLEAARASVARHHSPVYIAEMTYLCGEIDSLRTQKHLLSCEIERKVDEHAVTSLLVSIDGLGALSAARIVAALGDPARFRNGAALAAYAGVVPGTSRSGLHRPERASLCPLGNARLRHGLYMTTLGAVRRNAWLRAYYQRLRANGKLPKVALGAAMRKLLLAVFAVAKHRRPFVAKIADVDGHASEAGDGP